MDIFPIFQRLILEKTRVNWYTIFCDGQGNDHKCSAEHLCMTNTKSKRQYAYL